MEEWKEYRLGDVCQKIGSGATPKGGKGAYHGGDYSLIRSQNVLDFSFSIDGLARINAEQAEDLKNVIVKPGDILLNITGDSVARTCIVPNDILPARVNQHVAILRSNGEEIINDFIFYYLQYKKKHLLLLASGGATRNALTKGMLEDFPIKAPSLSVQKNIVSVLKEIDDKIELNKRINDNLEQQAQALFKHWFVDFGPFKNGEFVESELGMIPKGWSVGKLGDLCKYSSEKISVKELKNYNYYSTENILPNKQGVISATKLPEVDKVIKCDPGDTVISNIRPYFKKIYYCSEDVAGCSADVLCFSPNNRLHSSFIYNILYSDRFFEYVMLGSKGTKMPRGDKKHIMDYQVVIPDEIYMKKYCIFASDTLEKIDICRKESRRLTQLRDTLLPKLMSGQIKL